LGRRVVGVRAQAGRSDVGSCVMRRRSGGVAPPLAGDSWGSGSGKEKIPVGLPFFALGL